MSSRDALLCGMTYPPLALLCPWISLAATSSRASSRRSSSRCVAWRSMACGPVRSGAEGIRTRKNSSPGGGQSSRDCGLQCGASALPRSHTRRTYINIIIIVWLYHGTPVIACPQVRSTIITAILGTDMKHHNDKVIPTGHDSISGFAQPPARDHKRVHDMRSAL